MATTKQNNGFSVTAYRGDAKTLLAFNLPQARAKGLAGFTIQCKPGNQPAYYLQNNLRFKNPAQHAQEPKESPTSSINAPIHKFRWVHVPGSLHQGTNPFYGSYTYIVTPRYFDAGGSLRALDPALGVSLALDVGPFAKRGVELGFTRGFTQSQAFVHHFGLKAIIRPKGKELLFDTSKVSGKNSTGQDYTFEDEYQWLGFTAREKVFGVLKEVLKDKSLHLDVFAYDLNEPDIIKIFLELAEEGRIRIILDNATLHHSTTSPKPEDQFETLFTEAAKQPSAMLRGKFGQYAHDKVLIVSKQGRAMKVLTGATNLSVTGFYVNSNHVLVFNDAIVADAYAQVFEAAWNSQVSMKFNQTPEAGKVFSFASATVPKTEITFSPHPAAFARKNLDDLVARIDEEGNQAKGSLLFAVMGLAVGTGPVLPALREIHKNTNIFSYGISDAPAGISLYTPRKRTGVLVTGKPASTKLPPPFDQVPGVGIGHQVHHKFVVCGFNGNDPVVYCGSSNLALGGEAKNGDNLLAIHDGDIATVFAIEALALVDHFDFLDRAATKAKTPKAKPETPSKQQQAVDAGWFLGTDDKWTVPYFDSTDLHCVDRELFA
jgi:phosphatidylserine/phosphatidylglycerophosphate/cardiolipin synthase-like enzyme